MTEIFCTQILLPEQFDILKNKLFDLLPEASIIRLQRYKNSNDIQRSILGECIVRLKLSEKLDCKPSEIPFVHSENGKPSLPECFGWHFNISHSGEYILAAISSNLVGIDVEKKRNTNLSVAKRFFHTKEYDFLISQSEEDQQDLFFRMWTLKESFVKAMGWGIANSLNLFSVIPENDSLHFECMNYNKETYFQQLNIDCDYYAAVCSIEDPEISDLQKFVF